MVGASLALNVFGAERLWRWIWARIVLLFHVSFVICTGQLLCWRSSRNQAVVVPRIDFGRRSTFYICFFSPMVTHATTHCVRATRVGVRVRLLNALVAKNYQCISSILGAFHQPFRWDRLWIGGNHYCRVGYRTINRVRYVRCMAIKKKKKTISMFDTRDFSLGSLQYQQKRHGGARGWGAKHARYDVIYRKFDVSIYRNFRCDIQYYAGWRGKHATRSIRYNILKFRCFDISEHLDMISNAIFTG